MQIPILFVALAASALAEKCLLKCPAGNVCILDPKPRCAVDNGECGGFGGIKCADATDKCIDDPRDDCDPKKAADCIGVCVAPRLVY